MQILNKSLSKNIDLDFLKCGLYTLLTTHKIFKNLNIKDDVYIENNSNNYLFTDVKIINKFSNLLNKPTIKGFAYYLLKPLFKTTTFLTFSKLENQSQNRKEEDEVILLKKYLKKFKYNYSRYFIYPNSNYKNVFTEKELNMYAIKFLFLIVGV